MSFSISFASLLSTITPSETQLPTTNFTAAFMSFANSAGIFVCAIEMIGQTFKGEKAKVTRIEKQKGEVVVSLLGASVPIPVTVKIDNVKVIRREESKEEKIDETKDSNSLDEELSEEFR